MYCVDDESCTSFYDFIRKRDCVRKVLVLKDSGGAWKIGQGGSQLWRVTRENILVDNVNSYLALKNPDGHSTYLMANGSKVVIKIITGGTIQVIVLDISIEYPLNSQSWT